MKVQIQEVNRPNLNKRIYPTKVLQNAIEKYITDFVKENRAFVCYKPPSKNVVDLTEVIGLVKSIRIEGEVVVSEIEQLKGVNESEKFWSLIEQGKIHVRTSGMGTITPQVDGTWVVGDDYELISLFITADPA